MQQLLNSWLRLATLTLAFIAGTGIAHADSLTLAWDPNPEPDVNGYIVYIGNAPGAYTQQIDVGNTTHYVLTTAPGQQYCFAVSAYVPGPIEGEQSTEVCTTSSGGAGTDLPPTLDNPGDQSSATGVVVALTLTGSDPEGAALTFSATGLPPGLSLASTGAVTGTPTQSGAFPITASVSDGSRTGSASFTWTVTAGTPGVPTLLSPSGATSSTTPMFEWEHVPTATKYWLWVDDNNTSASSILQIELTPTQAGCAAGTVCRHNPGTPLAAGPGSWSARALNAAGASPWSGAKDFSIADGKAPTVTITTPTAGATHSASSPSVAIGGTASDDVGVVQVTWSNDRGGAGSATGTATWNVATVPLSQGVNVITVTARDAENNISTDKLTITRTDGQPPTIDITLPATAVSYSTTETAIAIGGTAADEFGVTEVRWSSSRGGSGVANGTTNWGVPAVALAAGSNVITVTARDSGGNSATDVITVTVVDGLAPTVTIVGPTSAPTFSTASATLTVSGTASDAFGVTQVTWANSRGGSGTASGTTGWTVSSAALQPGENVITITARDAAGQAATDTLTVTRTDSGAPAVAITAPTSQPTHSTSQATVALSGTASDDFGVSSVTWVSDRGGSGTAYGTTSWSIASVPLLSGTNTITVTATDASGQKGSDVVVVTRADGEKPTVAITSPTSADAHSTATAAFTLGGTAADDSSVAQVTWSNSRGGAGTATGTTSWSVSDITLQPGSNVVTVTARDSNGNTATDTLTVTLTDNAAPAISIAVPTDAPAYSTLNTSVPLSGSASDVFGVTEVRWANDRGGSGLATGTSAWSVASVALSPGANVITVTARDAAGQSSSDTVTVTRTDGDTPTVSISTPTANPTLSVTAPTIALGGTAADNFGITQVNWTNDRGGSGLATGTSTWSVAGVALKAGANVITVTARDAAGNVGRASLNVMLTDGVGPEVRFTTPTSSANFGTSAPTLSIGGTAADEFAVARVAWANDRGGSGVANGTTSWSASGITLRSGTNVITVTATDAAGNSGSAKLSVVATDGSRPTVTISTPGPKTRFLTPANSVAIAGTAADDFGLASVTWSNDRGGSGSVSGTTTWSVASVALQPGTNVVTVTATDEAGNRASDVLRVVSDTNKPGVTISQPVTSATHAVNARTIALGGVATDDVGVTEVSWSSNRGRNGVATGTGTWNATGVTLEPGVNTLTVTARDEVGNTGTATLTVVLDARAPGVTIESPTTDPTTASHAANVALRGTASDDVGVTQVTWTNDRGGSGTASGATTWTIPNVALQPGVNVLTVTARDAAGNTSTDSLSVHLDSRAPVVTISSPTTSTTFAASSPTVALAGAATDDGAITEVRWTNNRGGGGVATGTNRWTVDRAVLQAGANEITITARDAAGNSASARLVVTASDKQAPAVRIIAPAPSDTFSTSARHVNLAGTATDDFGVTQVAWASDRGTSGVARGTGTWLAGAVALQPGVNIIAVTALDSAGNSSTDVLKITVDAQPPVVTITSPSSSSFTSTTPSVVVSGTAADDAGIMQVLWASDRGPSGAAVGTSSWATPAIRLEPGPNVVAVTARDVSGNSTTATLTILYRDSAAPVVTIGSPTTGSLFSTSAPVVSLGGMAKDDFGVAQVSWSNDRGGSGVAFGTTGWNVAAIPLTTGMNVITVTARDAAGLTGTATLRVMRTGGEARGEPSVAAPVSAPPVQTAPRTPSSAGSAPTGGISPDPTAPASQGPAASASGPANPSPSSYPLPNLEAMSPPLPQTPSGRTPAPRSAPPSGIDVPEPPDVSPERPIMRPPAVTIAAPSANDEFVTNDASVTLAGTAREASEVTWTTNNGSSGTATGRDRWRVPDFALPVGKTVITVTARSADGDIATDTVTITRRSSNPIKLDITSPTADSAWVAPSSTVALRGVASDNVVRVTWHADWGGTGTATGTQTWSISTIGLQIGINRITVIAHDAEGRMSRKVVSVDYQPRVASSR
jgi:hypothetical protein